MTEAPGLSHRIPIPYGSFREFVRDPLGFQLRAREQFGDVLRLRIGPFTTYFLYHPDHVRHVLSEHQKNYRRGWHYQLMRRLFGHRMGKRLRLSACLI